ncbi:hypothetical protein [Streptomyces sp. NPDC048392]|uniref:hypothetical protein n=1 Tax=Streptomyces sp. NPDC048392 TaxID=3365543 RepID=UPI0037112A59
MRRRPAGRSAGSRCTPTTRGRRRPPARRRTRSPPFLGDDPRPPAPREAAPARAEAPLARDPAGEAPLPLGGKDVVERARVRVVAVMGAERFLREETRGPGARRVLLERQRAVREGYGTAVREDLAPPPGHGARWPLPPVSGSR